VVLGRVELERLLDLLDPELRLLAHRVVAGRHDAARDDRHHGGDEHDHDDDLHEGHPGSVSAT
jgi:hypothetical protein